MNRFDISKFSFYAVSILAVLGLSFAFGLYSAHYETIVFETVQGVAQSFRLVLEESSTLTKTHPSHFLQPAKYEGSGVTVNNATTDKEELIFMSGFFEGGNELRIIRRDGTIVARWPVIFSEIFPDASHMISPPTTDWNIDIHGAVALPDGSVVFNLVYAGVVKLDLLGNTVWKLPRDTHHSVELAEGGGFWVCGTRNHPKEADSSFPPFETPFREDIILKVSEDGEVLSEISVPKLIYDNGLEALLTSTGDVIDVGMTWDKELLHLNDVEELSSDIADKFPMFEANDLLLSLRNYNLIMVISPETGKIKWWKIGPWLRQHDPEFTTDGTIVVFNNNTYRTAFGKRPHSNKSRVTIPRISNIIEYDPNSDTHRVLYGGDNNEEMLSVIRGKVAVTQNGGLLVTEFEGGRVFETDNERRIVWEYINQYDSDEVAEITGARIYHSSYFSETNWVN
jgi:hypothetical protein